MALAHDEGAFTLSARQTRVRLRCLRKPETASALLAGDYALAMGRAPDLAAPALLSERLLWLRLYARDPLLPVLAERAQQQEFARAKGCARALARVYAAGPTLRSLRLGRLPKAFTLYAAHLPDACFTVEARTKPYMRQMAQRARAWLGRSQSARTGEMEYLDAQPGLQAEEALVCAERLRLLCFSGVPTAVYAPDRPSVLYDETGRGWAGGESLTDDAKTGLPEAVELARALSADFVFARLEFACTAKGSRFVGMRFSEDMALLRALPAGADRELGSRLRLPQNRSM